MDERSDEELLVDGGPEGFGLLYERRYTVVRGYLAARMRSRPDVVLDLVAETFARALENRTQFDPARGSALGWLLGISRHLLHDAARRGRVDDRSRQRLGLERLLVEDEQLERLARDSGGELQRALSALPADQREAIERRVLDEEPYEVVAAGIGCSPQVARKRVSRGLAALRRGTQENG